MIAMLSRIRKNDNVIVIAGKDKGKQGAVIKVAPDKDAVLVKNINIVTRHIKAKRSGETSRILKEESYIPLSKVMPICKSCKKPCRVQTKVLDSGSKVRVCHHCKEAF